MYNIVLRNFILEHKDDWEELLTKPPYSLKISRDNGYIMFKYSQIESDFNLPLVREARGIIFDESTWDCVCHPFNKFGNYGESYCPEINWNNAVVSEKVDGSLIKLWYDKGSWHVSTNGTIDAKKADLGDINVKTFYDLFMKALNDSSKIMFSTLTNSLNSNYTYMYELVSPYNRVVVPHKETKLYVLGARNMITGEELGIPELKTDFNLEAFSFPKIYKLDTLESVLEASRELPWDDEGYVVYDDKFNRVKIKSPKYVTAHYARNNSVVNDKRLVEVILNGEKSEFLIYASDYAERINDLESTMESIRKTCNWFYEKVMTKEYNSRKELAEYVKTFPKYSHPYLFKAYGNDLMFEDFSKDWNADNWLKAIDALKS